MKTFMKQSKKGFTLIEMIVVIVIVAILAAISVPAVMKYIDDAQDAKMIAITQPIFLETQVVTIEFFGKYGNTGTIVTDEGKVQETSTPTLIVQEMARRFKDQPITGDYKVGVPMTVFFDDMSTHAQFDKNKKTHYVSKFGVMLVDSKYNYLFIVFKSNDEARVFKLPEEKAIVYDPDSEWYCPPN